MGLDLATSAAFLGLGLALAGLEVWGVVSRRRGDTITENWRWVNRWLSQHAPAAGWVWRVATIGLLVWTTLHFAVGGR